MIRTLFHEYFTHARVMKKESSVINQRTEFLNFQPMQRGEGGVCLLQLVFKFLLGSLKFRESGIIRIVST